MPDVTHPITYFMLLIMVLALHIHMDNIDDLLEPILPPPYPLFECQMFPIFLMLLHLEMKQCFLRILSQRGVRDTISPYYVEPRSLHWWNHYVQVTSVNDARFRDLFRLPIALFQNLCDLLNDQLRQGDIPLPLASIRGRLISVEKQVALSVLRLASGTRTIELSEHFGLGKSTVVKIINRFFDALLVHLETFISFPQNADALAIVKATFEARQGLPNCCGAMDVTHIVMDKPAFESAVDWYDRNSNYSMSLQAVVDAKMRFLDVFAGWPGSANDARVLRNSSFFRCVLRGTYLASPPMRTQEYTFRDYVVADGAYRLQPWLMVPYGAPRTRMETNFNFKLSSTRIIVEQAFGKLKMNWQYLNKKILKPQPKNVAKAIVVACILHNMLLSVTHDEDDPMQLDQPPCLPQQRDPQELATTRESKRARDELAEYLEQH